MIVDINSLTYDSFICGVKCDTNIKNSTLNSQYLSIYTRDNHKKRHHKTIY